MYMRDVCVHFIIKSANLSFKRNYAKCGHTWYLPHEKFSAWCQLFFYVFFFKSNQIKSRQSCTFCKWNQKSAFERGFCIEMLTVDISFFWKMYSKSTFPNCNISGPFLSSIWISLPKWNNRAHLIRIQPEYRFNFHIFTFAGIMFVHINLFIYQNYLLGKIKESINQCFLCKQI